jgi:hypothetical protein
MSAKKVPVALIFFKRMCVLEVIERIRAYGPECLFLIADGGKNEEEQLQCVAVRKEVEAAIDWPCRVQMLYSDDNLGCRKRIPSGLDWLFSQVDRAIILEDDVIPIISFFLYCQEILERYADNSRVWVVSGSNYVHSKEYCNEYSYLFSGYAELCGFATWRRAWQYYDREMSLWPEAHKLKLLKSFFLGRYEQAYWERIFQEVYDHTCTCDPWDFQWLFSSWLNGALSVVPKHNQLTNIGWGADATHTKTALSFLEMPATELTFPLHHPPMVVRNAYFDRDYGRVMFYGTAYGRIRRKSWVILMKCIVMITPRSVRKALRAAYGRCFPSRIKEI